MKRLLTKFWVYLSITLLGMLLTLVLQPHTFEPWLESLHMTVIQAIAQDTVQPQPDRLVTQAWWQDQVKFQVNISRGQQYRVCLFGDSISAGLGNTLGDRTFNFALGGMSSVSLLDQLNQLVAAGVQCNRVIIAVGTYDADYQITNDQFVSNMQAAIARSRQLKAAQILLLPAFYLQARNIAAAAPIARVAEINALLRQVATSQNVSLITEGLQPLCKGQALRDNLTVDGVHLNAEGKVIYRNALLRLLKTAS